MVYVMVYADPVRRTNIYLSAAEQEALDARAAVEGCSRSDVVRAVIDRELNLEDEGDVDVLIGDLAAEFAESARRSSSQDPDLRSE